MVPSIWFTSFPQLVWIATDSLAIQLLQKTVFNSDPNLNWKWNCKGDIIQIFSSEIILAWENGSQGPHFGKILISKFLKGLCHSAMYHYCLFPSATINCLTADPESAKIQCLAAEGINANISNVLNTNFDTFFTYAFLLQYNNNRCFYMTPPNKFSWSLLWYKK